MAKKSKAKFHAPSPWFPQPLAAAIVQVALLSSQYDGTDFQNVIRVMNHLLVKKTSSQANKPESRARTVGYLRDLIHNPSSLPRETSGRSHRPARPGPGNFNPSQFQQLFYKTRAELDDEDGDTDES